jgi:hypothetical protein
MTNLCIPPENTPHGGTCLLSNINYHGRQWPWVWGENGWYREHNDGGVRLCITPEVMDMLGWRFFSVLDTKEPCPSRATTSLDAASVAQININEEK